MMDELDTVTMDGLPRGLKVATRRDLPRLTARQAAKIEAYLNAAFAFSALRKVARQLGAEA